MKSRAREEFCDYFHGNSFQTDPTKMQKYYDDFALLETTHFGSKTEDKTKTDGDPA